MEVDNSEPSTSALTAVIEPLEGTSDANGKLAPSTSQTTPATAKSDLHAPWYAHTRVRRECLIDINLYCSLGLKNTVQKRSRTSSETKKQS